MTSIRDSFAVTGLQNEIRLPRRDTSQELKSILGGKPQPLYGNTWETRTKRSPQTLPDTLMQGQILARRADTPEGVTPDGGKPTPLCTACWYSYQRIKRLLLETSSVLRREGEPAQPVIRAVDTSSKNPTPDGGKPTPLCGFCWERWVKRKVPSSPVSR